MIIILVQTKIEDKKKNKGCIRIKKVFVRF